MFGDLPRVTLSMVLESHSGNMERTVDYLLGLSPQEMDALRAPTSDLEVLEALFEDGDVVDAEALVAKGLVWSRMARQGEKHEKVMETHLIKILGRGELTKKLTVKANKFSKSAAEAIAAAGGQSEVI